MDALTIAAASGLQSRMQSLEMLANNLANSATGGYKTDREFYSLYFSSEAKQAAVDGSSPEPPTLPVIERHWTDFSQGLLRATGNPFDLALNGRGFFSVNGPAGRLYTRTGGLRLSAAGILSTAEGYPVRAVGGGPVRVDSSAPIEVSPEGTVKQNGAILGQLELVDFGDPAVLRKQGASYFRIDGKVTPSPATGVEVRQGRLEGSNVTAAEGAVRLVGVMRQFEMLQKAMALGAEMNRKAVEEVARVGT